jgi:lipid-A-disaccharide synthase
VIYKLTLLNRLYGQYILKLALPHFCIVNILSNDRIFPELIEEEATADALYLACQTLNRQKAQEGARSVMQMLQKNESPSYLAAKSVMEMLT